MFIPAPYSPIPEDWPVITMPYNFYHSPIGMPIAVSGAAASVSGAWTTANTAVAFPFWVYESVTVYKIGFQNGSAAGGNSDVGIYNASWSLLVSTGSVTRTGNNAVQWVDVTDTALSPNTQYYIAANHSQTTSNNVAGWPASTNTANILTLGGLKQMAVGATTLPATFVPADPSAARLVPRLFLSFNPTIV